MSKEKRQKVDRDTTLSRWREKHTQRLKSYILPGDPHNWPKSRADQLRDHCLFIARMLLDRNGLALKIIERKENETTGR